MENTEYLVTKTQLQLLPRKPFGDRRIGGNAELVQDTDEWFRALAYDPALITVQKYVPWSDIVTDATVKAHLEAAVIKRIDAANDARQEQVNNVIRQRKVANISAELILWTITSTSSLTVVSNITDSISVSLNNALTCGTGLSLEKRQATCNFPRTMTACALVANSKDNMTTQVPISYERNLITEDMRVVALRQNGIASDKTPFKNRDLIGNWVRRGCSEIVNEHCGILANQNVHRVQLCTRCRVLCANQNNVNLDGDCPCPTLSQNNCPEYSGISPYRPYCSNEE